MPVGFNDKQKEAIKDAVKLAGLDLKYLLYEPNAAAVAYNHKENVNNSKILVFDFGGG